MRLVDAAVPLVAEAQLSHALLSARTYKTAAGLKTLSSPYLSFGVV